MHRPSLFTILYTDDTALFSALFPLIFGATYLSELVSRPDTASYFGAFNLVAVLLVLIVLIWRVRTISTVFEEGQRVPGRLTQVSFYRGRGRIHYAYTFNGKNTTLSTPSTRRSVPPPSTRATRSPSSSTPIAPSAPLSASSICPPDSNYSTIRLLHGHRTPRLPHPR